jgi:hypothetical protein
MSTLKPSLLRLRALLLTQRTLRLLLRAAWTGLAGYLLGWGLHDLYGTFPNSQTWLAFGLALALPSLITLLRPLPMPHLAWNLDRRFALREQLSAAWQYETQTSSSPLVQSLLTDAETLLPPQRTRILRRGWFLTRDLTAALIVATLFVTVNAFSQANTPLDPAPTLSPLALPPLAEAPTYEDLFPSGIPGLTETPPDPNQPDPLTPEQATPLDDLLSDLGEALSENPETAPAGEALQQGDLAQAASEIEQLADTLEGLPSEARENAEDALRAAADQAQQAGEEDLADALEQAANGLEAPESNNLEAAEALDELASEFRKLEDQFAALGQAGDQEPADESSNGEQPTQEGTGGSAAGTGNNSEETQPEPLERLEGEGQTVELAGDETPSGLLTPGEASDVPATGDTGPIIASSDGLGETDLINSILAPYSFPWRWRDVVSKYFSPPQ